MQHIRINRKTESQEAEDVVDFGHLTTSHHVPYNCTVVRRPLYVAHDTTFFDEGAAPITRPGHAQVALG